jgi:hypothetical protein
MSSWRCLYVVMFTVNTWIFFIQKLSSGLNCTLPKCLKPSIALEVSLDVLIFHEYITLQATLLLSGRPPKTVTLRTVSPEDWRTANGSHSTSVRAIKKVAVVQFRTKCVKVMLKVKRQVTSAKLYFTEAPSNHNIISTELSRDIITHIWRHKETVILKISSRETSYLTQALNRHYRTSLYSREL